MAGHCYDFIWFASIAKDRHSTVFPVAASGRQDSSNELIVGKILSERLADPGIEAQDGFDTDAVGVWPEQVGPFVGPIVGVFGSFEQRIDQGDAFLGVGVLKEIASLIAVGLPTDDINKGAAQELRIRSGFARNDIQVR